MPTCQNCGHKWSWKMTLKKSFTLSNEMKCPVCGVTQFATAKSRKRMSLLSFIIAPSLILSSHFFNFSIETVILIAVLLFGVVLVVYPFLYELSNEEEPMW